MNTEQQEAIKTLKSFLKNTRKSRILFSLGMITGFAIVGFFEAIEYQYIYPSNIPWFVYVVIAIITTVMVGQMNER